MGLPEPLIGASGAYDGAAAASAGEDLSVSVTDPEDEGLAERFVRRISGLNSAQAVSYGTEGGHFQQAGISTVVFGPGSISVAHQANEHIDLSQIRACEDFLHKVGDFAAGTIEIEEL